MRGSVMFKKSSALWLERMTRSSVWQPTQLRKMPLRGSLPGTLLIHSALLAHNGVSIQENLQVGMRKYFRSNIAPFHDHAATRSEFALPGHHPLAHLGMSGYARGRLRNILFTHASGHLAPVKQHSIPPERRLNSYP